LKFRCALSRRAGSAWIALPAALAAAGILLLVGWFVVAWQRNLRAARRYRPRPLQQALVTKEHPELRTPK
jgi:hypothetical protein